MTVSKSLNIMASWIIGFGSFAAVVRAWPVESWVPALILLLGIMGLAVAVIVRRGPPWGRLVYAVWASLLVVSILVKDIQVEPDLTNILLGFCLYAGAFALIGLSIRSRESDRLR